MVKIHNLQSHKYVIDFGTSEVNHSNLRGSFFQLANIHFFGKF